MGIFKTHGLPNCFKQRSKGSSVLLQKVLAYKLITRISEYTIREVYYVNCTLCSNPKTLSIVTTQILLAGGEKIVRCPHCRTKFKTYYRCT